MNNKDKTCNECSCEIDPSVLSTKDFLDDDFDDEFVCKMCRTDVQFARFDADFQKEFGDAIRK